MKGTFLLRVGKKAMWLLLLGHMACQPARYVPKGKQLLLTNPKVEQTGDLPANVLEEAITTKANRRVFYPKLYLGMYNLGKDMQTDSSWSKRNLLKVNRVRNWYQNTTQWLVEDIGEPPVVLDLKAVKADSANLWRASFGEGYFHPQVSYRIEENVRTLGTKGARVIYQVDPGQGRKIRKVRLTGPDGMDGDLKRAFRLEESTLKSGQPYRHRDFIRERVRATTAMRNAGYFTFSQKMIEFEVDTQVTDSGFTEANGNALPLDVEIMLLESPPLFTIKKVQINIKSSTNRDQQEDLPTASLSASLLSDSLRRALGITQDEFHDSLTVQMVVDRSILHRINYNFLSRRIHIRAGRPFNQADSRKTQQRLQELGMFQYVIMNNKVNEATREIDVIIDLQMAPHYQVKTGMESFMQNLNFSNIPSLGANLSLRNRNTFRKSELLEWSIQGSLGFYASTQEASQFEKIYYELGTELRLSFPRFLLPGSGQRDLSLLSPSTDIASDFAIERRQEFNRNRTTLQLRYKWNHLPFSDQAVSILSPLELKFINISTDSTFQADIVDDLPPSIRQDFENRFSSSFHYRFTYQNYRKTRLYRTYFLQMDAEFGGNIPWILDELNVINRSDNPDQDTLAYGQYIKLSLEGKYAVPIGERAEWVFRAFVGGSVPYNRTLAVPRESRFFSGGTASMRGWRSNTLGPGRSKLTDFQEGDSLTNLNGLSLIAPGGEWILELNAEFRVDLISYLELAFFTDLGNVWFHNNERVRNELGASSVLSLPNLRLGWDAGVGFRFDFSFLILRLDFGQQIYAPDLNSGWVFGSPEVINPLSRFQVNLGIGYPF